MGTEEGKRGRYEAAVEQCLLLLPAYPSSYSLQRDLNLSNLIRKRVAASEKEWQLGSKVRHVSE